MPSTRPHARGPRRHEPPTGRLLGRGWRGSPLWRTGVSVVAALLLAACSAAPAPEAAEVAALPREQRQRMVFDSVWAIVGREHVDSTLAGVDWAAARTHLRERAAHATDERALYRVLGDLLAPLGDAHTYVTTPSAVAREQARRSAARDIGLGISLETLDGSVVVSDVQPASAAGIAGVQPGWVVRTWNGMDVDSTSLAAGRFGASRGDTVAVAFADTLDTVHEHLLVPADYAWRHPRGIRRDGDVAIVRVPSFEPGTGAWFAQLVAAQLVAAQRGVRPAPRALVIDLRANPGGQMADLSAALSALYRERQPVGRFIARDGTAGKLELRGAGDYAFTGPVVVLVDHRSGSAAEIFAAVVQGSARGRIVGERTVGAVLNAFPYKLPDGGRLHVSRRDFRDLCDVRLEHAGVAPALPIDVVHRTLADARHRADPALAHALAVLRDSSYFSTLGAACGS